MCKVHVLYSVNKVVNMKHFTTSCDSVKINVLLPIASPALVLFLKQTGNEIPVCLYGFRNTLPVGSTRHSSFDDLNCVKTEKEGLGGLVMV